MAGSFRRRTRPARGSTTSSLSDALAWGDSRLATHLAEAAPEGPAVGSCQPSYQTMLPACPTGWNGTRPVARSANCKVCTYCLDWNDRWPDNNFVATGKRLNRAVHRRKCPSRIAKIGRTHSRLDSRSLHLLKWSGTSLGLDFDRHVRGSQPQITIGIFLATKLGTVI